MDGVDLQRALRESFEDYRLSRRERQALRLLLEESLDDGARRELRRAAFELARAGLEEGFGGDALAWLEGVVALVDAGAPSWSAEAHFSPGDACLRRIVSLLDHAAAAVDACVFTITDDRISRAIEAAHRRGVRVRIVSDDDKARDAGSDIARLARAGVAVVVDRSPAHMHHKFAVFDRRVLLSGSYNWTRGAADSNSENILVTGDPRLVRAYQTEFDGLWEALAPGV
jgi:phosphatidylserine/phosphatidylglycerophosphate/cardiolipin synthase-like enzyme